MAVLTITIPDELAQAAVAWPEEKKAAYLAEVNAFAVARFSDVNAGINASDNAVIEDTAPFTEADGKALMEAFADFDAGDRGKPAAESFARIAERLRLEDTTLFTEADGEALKEDFADFDVGKYGKPACDAWKDIAAKYGFKSPVLC